MKRFTRGDCDATGIKRYGLPSTRLTYDNNEVVTAQNRLVQDGFLVTDDIDGNVGPATLRAIEQWESSRDRDFYQVVFDVDPVRVSQLKPVMIDGVAHVCQAFFNIDLVPGEPCKKSGCLSCCVEVCKAHQDNRDPKVYDFIVAMKERNGYNASGQIRWPVMTAITGMQHYRGITLDEAHAHIESGTPIIVDIGGHFIIGVGYDDRGIHCHDVGRRLGNCYDNPNLSTGSPRTYCLNDDIKDLRVLV